MGKNKKYRGTNYNYNKNNNQRNNNQKNNEQKSVQNNSQNYRVVNSNNGNKSNSNINSQANNNSNIKNNSNQNNNYNKNRNSNNNSNSNKNHYHKNYNPNKNYKNKKKNYNQNNNQNKNKEFVSTNKQNESPKQQTQIKNNVVQTKVAVKTEPQKENIKTNTYTVSSKEKTTKKNSIVWLWCSIAVVASFLIVIGYFSLNYYNKSVLTNVYIQGIDISNLTKDETRKKIKNEFDKYTNSNIKCIYLDKEYNINLKELGFKYEIEDAVDDAMKIGRNDNLAKAFIEFYSLKLGKTEDMKLGFEYNSELLNSKLKEFESSFYQEVKQYSYTVEEDILKIQNGVKGIKLDYNQFDIELSNRIINCDFDTPIELPVIIEEPEEIDLSKIHSEIYKQMVNASYTLNPFQIHNEERGVNFDVKSLKEMIELEPDKSEYQIALIITPPEITVDNLGLYDTELGACSTWYVNNPNRTNNLRLAASKVDGMILMPGEEFSYNDIVGERTYSAGYRNAAIFINGEVEDGLGGGICQISSTIYNAVVEADLEIVERSNHARVPSYLPAGKDATVYWGSKDFKFKNNREYPVKIEVSVEGGLATARILGKATENEYEISIETDVVSRYNGWLVVNAYKVYRQNGEVVKSELLSTDEYKIG